MPAAVETMAYRGQVPWHGLGNLVKGLKTIKEWLKAGGIDWEVELVPMMAPMEVDHDGKHLVYSDYTQPVPNFYALRRKSDKRIFDVTGRRYTPTQNHQAFEFFSEFVDAGDAKMETVGSLHGGRYVWGLANLDAGFVLPGEDKVDGYVLVGCPHEQGKSLIFKRTGIRVVCMNTLMAALREKSGAEFRFPHRTTFDAKAIQKAKEVLGLARDDIRQFEKDAKALVELEISLSQMLSIVVPIMSPKATPDKIMDMIESPENYTPRIKTLMKSYTDAPGATPGNGWGVLNAVTHYCDHVVSRTQDQRLSNSWFGKTGRQKQLVMDKLLAMTV